MLNKIWFLPFWFTSPNQMFWYGWPVADLQDLQQRTWGTGFEFNFCNNQSNPIAVFRAAG